MAAHLSHKHFIAFSFAVLVLPAAAQETVSGGAGTLWTCRYDRDRTVQCELARVAAVKLAADSGVVNTPPLVSSLRSEPENYAARRVLISTHTVTSDWERVRLLAEAAVCGTRSDCSVEFLTSPGEMALASGTGQ